ncbi:hypothetical protein K1719_039069 [Acacia pycnantha]|nr:hypothetical protein K1719_039069 [Acacia pycnantha]
MEREALEKEIESFKNKLIERDNMLREKENEVSHWKYKVYEIEKNRGSEVENLQKKLQMTEDHFNMYRARMNQQVIELNTEVRVLTSFVNK